MNIATKDIKFRTGMSTNDDDGTMRIYVGERCFQLPRKEAMQLAVDITATFLEVAAFLNTKGNDALNKQITQKPVMVGLAVRLRRRALRKER